MGYSSKVVLGVLIVGLLAVVAGSAAAEDGWIAGRVWNASMDPISGATVAVVGGTQTTTTNATGYYNMSAPEGNYSVKASKSGFIDLTKSGIIVTANNTTTANFMLDPVTGWLTGTVKGDDGSAVQYASVKKEGALLGAMTDAQGKYNLTGLSLGATNFTVTSIDYPQYNFTMTIVAGVNTKDVTLVMETYVMVYVTGPTVLGVPFPLEGATVTVGSATGTTNALGSCKLVVTPGSYKMSISAKDYKTATKDITVTRGANSYEAKLSKTSGTSEDTGFLAGLLALGLLFCILPIILIIVVIVVIIWLVVRRKKNKQAVMTPPPPAPPQTPPPGAPPAPPQS